MSPSTAQRIWAGFLALLLGHFFIVVQVRDAWTRYWVLKDGQQGKALITKVLWTGHNGVTYHYQVNGKGFTGQDAAEYAHRVVGAQPAVFFSSSHPWLSTLRRPKTAMLEGLPVLLLVWFLIALFILTAINPRHRWALQIGIQPAKSPSMPWRQSPS